MDEHEIQEVEILSVGLVPGEDGGLRGETVVRDKATGRVMVVPGGPVEVVARDEGGSDTPE